MTAVYACFFLGQGGLLFSSSFKAIADKADALDIGTRVYNYTDIEQARRDILALKRLAKTALIGYSLGVTSITYLQRFLPVDLLIAVAPSTLAGNNNEIINHSNTKRSIALIGTDFLSSAGRHDGYDEVINVQAGFGIPIFSHLLIPNQPIVINTILTELQKLKGK